MKRKSVSRIGIVGAGQLGRMMALAGYPLNLRCSFLDASTEAPAAQLAPLVLGGLEDPVKLAELAASSDVVTFDWENAPAAALATIRGKVPIHPSPRALALAQDRLHEKALFRKLAIPVVEHRPIDTRRDLERALAALGGRAVLKTRRLGYDGKGQALITSPADAEAAFERLRGVPLILERFVDFESEVSLLGVRSTKGEVRFYPLSHNTHAAGILRFTRAPHPSAALERMARRHVRRILERLRYVGVLAVEFFVVDGRLVANEMAPRVHNSGHWTIEGCVTSQFENHLRAISGLPLGDTRPLGHAAMINFLGRMPDRQALLEIESLAYHDYGKSPRPGRKLGHCTILKRSPRERDRALRLALRRIEWA